MKFKFYYDNKNYWVHSYNIYIYIIYIRDNIILQYLATIFEILIKL